MSEYLKEILKVFGRTWVDILTPVSTLCKDCKEPICPHGVCWCQKDETYGYCQQCDDQEEAEYQAEQNARYYSATTEELDEVFGDA